MPEGAIPGVGGWVRSRKSSPEAGVLGPCPTVSGSNTSVLLMELLGKISLFYRGKNT